MNKHATTVYESDASACDDEDDECVRHCDAPPKPLLGMTPVEAKAHVEEVVRLIHSVSKCEAYTVHLTELRQNEYEIEVRKKADVKQDAGMVTPHFPVRVKLNTQNGRNVQCSGTLISPLISPIDDKHYRPIAGVPIGCTESLTDFLFLHLSLGFTVAQSVYYIREALAPLDPQVSTELKIELLDTKGFLFRYKDTAVYLKVLPDMRTVMQVASGVEQTMPTRHATITRADFEGHTHLTPHSEWAHHASFSHDDPRGAFLEFVFDGSKQKHPPVMHPTTKKYAGEILAALMLPMGDY